MANPNMPTPAPPKWSRYSFLIIILIAVLMLSYAVKNPMGQEQTKISYSKFLDYTDDKNPEISDVKYMDAQSRITGKMTDGKTFVVTVPKGSKAVDDALNNLRKHGVKVSIEPPGMKESLGSVFYMIIIPAILFIGLWYMIMRQANMGGSQAMQFGRSRAKLLTGNYPKVTFEDVAGIDEAKEELEEIIEFLKDPSRFQDMGAKIPKGVLLVGPPGAGKTLLARAVAGEADVPFFHMSGSDFVEMFVGVGASRVRDLFDQAKRHSPCLVFIDEIDAVGRQRGAGLGGGHDEREQTLNQLLVEMDGFDANVGVILLAATNRPDVLDPALLRPGRFDRRVVVDRPDVKGRLQILKVHGRGKKISPDVDLFIVARRTPGFTGADLENVMNEAALLAARKREPEITAAHIDEAIERNVAGPERKSRLLSEKARKITAYHEAGHALMARLLPDTDPVHKISILPRGMALGYTLQLPLEDKFMIAKNELLDDICVLLGGRVAEELVFGAESITTGAANDLDRVKKIARKMVCEFGMTESLGPITFGRKNDAVFLGRALAEERDYSEEMAARIDDEIKDIVNSCYNKTESQLKKYFERLTLVAERLLEKETLGGVRLENLLDGKDLPDEEVDRLESERRDIERGESDERKRVEQEEAKEKESQAEPQPEPVPVLAASETTPESAPNTRDGLLARFSGMLDNALKKNYSQLLSDSVNIESLGLARDLFNQSDFENAVRHIRQSIRECRDNDLIPGLRIMSGLAYLKLGDVERMGDELTAALMAAPGKLESGIERLLVAAVSYARILNEELKNNNTSLSKLAADPAAIEIVDSRYREWEKRTGHRIEPDAPAV